MDSTWWKLAVRVKEKAREETSSLAPAAEEVAAIATRSRSPSPFIATETGATGAVEGDERQRCSDELARIAMRVTNISRS